jgi:hypothetical protein
MQGIIEVGLSSCSTSGINGFGSRVSRRYSPEYTRGTCHNIADPHCTRGPISGECTDKDENNDGMLAYTPQSPYNATAGEPSACVLLSFGNEVANADIVAVV